LLISYLVVVTLLVASCAPAAALAAEEVAPTEETPTPTPAAAEMKITVTAKYPSFQPSTFTVAEGQIVELTLTSTDTFHTFTIDELGISVAVGAGQTVTKEFTVEKAGTFTFYCTVPRNRAAGT
jgi:heme/copper-type cytochrome/quinol oxidase subunit 2